MMAMAMRDDVVVPTSFRASAMSEAERRNGIDGIRRLRSRWCERSLT